MAGGQAIDLDSVGKQLSLPELEFMHIHKTGALIRAAVLLGAHCGELLDDAQLNRLDRFSKCVGLAFQVVDDVLDSEADTATLGKTAGKDADNDKPTYVTLLGVQAAKKMAAELHGEALDALCRIRRRSAPLARAGGLYRVEKVLMYSLLKPSTPPTTCARWSASNCRNWRMSCASS